MKKLLISFQALVFLAIAMMSYYYVQSEPLKIAATVTSLIVAIGFFTWSKALDPWE